VTSNVFHIKSYDAVKPGVSLDSNFCAEVIVEQAAGRDRHALTVGFMQDLHCVWTNILYTRIIFLWATSRTIGPEHVSFPVGLIRYTDQGVIFRESEDRYLAYVNRILSGPAGAVLRKGEAGEGTAPVPTSQRSAPQIKLLMSVTGHFG